ncbi:MAG: UDP-2,4-diacetamido-2,4,6-trideoxy-beta-L-altropyranose hydrolase [Caulobacteraceae bacterium]|nr:UDP-2,4-diacetamido-2,4,6-trideoxy-beta-L-altropyranose hydrolase [Caulobacteraceae bacterium]
MNAPAILFVVDGGPEIGGGHVLRSLTLAAALRARGASTRFLAPPFVAALLDRFGPDVDRLETDAANPADLAEAAVAAAPGFDGLVYDHFRLGAREHYRIAGGRPSLAIDELADRRLGVDMVLDVGPDRRPRDYQGLVEPEARLLLGPGYALVRPAFAEARRTGPRRGEGSGLILVSLGLTDVGGITGRVVDRLTPRLGEGRLEVVLGRAAESLGAMQRLAGRDPRVALHVETEAMAELCAGADLCVGAGGSSSWERCVTGLPTVLVVLADNQEPGARALAAAGAAEVVDARSETFEGDFDRAILGLLRSPERRARMSRAASALCDGEGAARVATAFLEMVGDSDR